MNFSSFLNLLMFVISCLNKILIAKEEYCHRDIFQPRCPSHEVIVIEEANFGRKTMGRCLSDEGAPSEVYHGDPKFLGCYTDVRNMLDPQCSGRQQCDMQVAKIDAEVSCHKWLKLYLEVKYTCVKVAEGNHQCKANLISERLHILKSRAFNTECGSKARPWTIESLPGQRINLRVVKFSESEGSERVYLTSDSPDKSCKVQVNVVDISNKRKTLVCTGEDDKKDSKDFESSSNSIEITFESADKLSTPLFLISLEATGCSDLIPPVDAWLKRTENEAIIGCYSTRLRWQLKCIGQRWIGVIGNCSQGHEPVKIEMPNGKVETNQENLVVTMVAIGMVGFVICFLIICLGVVFLNRYYAMNKSKAIKQMSSFYNDSSNVPNYGGKPILQADNNLFYNTGNRDVRLNSQKGHCLENQLTKGCENNAQYFELEEALVKKDVM